MKRKFAFDWGGSLENNESLRQIARLLYANGYEVWIIPAAGATPSDETYFAWLHAINVQFTGFRRVLVNETCDPVYTAQGKVQAMLETGCTVLYDDNEHNIEAVRQAGLEGILVNRIDDVPKPKEIS